MKGVERYVARELNSSLESDPREEIDLQTRADEVKDKQSVKEIIENPDHDITDTLTQLKEKKYGSFDALFGVLTRTKEFQDLIDAGNDDAVIYAVCKQLAQDEFLSKSKN